MKKLFLPVSFLFALSVFSYAQPYRSAVGARLGSPLSASYKHFINDSHAFEVYAGARWFSGYRWTNISGAYLIHGPIDEVEGLRWYAGGGASVFFWSFNGLPGAEYATTSYGIQAYGGLDYSFKDAPVSLTIDWIPTLFFNGYSSGFGGGYGSLGVRYILSR